MTTQHLPDFIRPGSIVHIQEWVARIVDVAVSATSAMVLVESPKMVYRNGRAEWLEYTLMPGAWRSATADEWVSEVNTYLRQLERKIKELEKLRDEVSREATR